MKMFDSFTISSLASDDKFSGLSKARVEIVSLGEDVQSSHFYPSTFNGSSENSMKMRNTL
jgi:hypothetical protein